MRNTKPPTPPATRFHNKKAFFAMVLFIVSFLYASYESSYDKYLERCLQYNTHNYCESTYRQHTHPHKPPRPTSWGFLLASGHTIHRTQPTPHAPATPRTGHHTHRPAGGRVAKIFIYYRRAPNLLINLQIKTIFSFLLRLQKAVECLD